VQVPLECIHLLYAYDIAPRTIHTASNQLLILSSIHFWQPSFLLVEFLQRHVLVPFTTCTLSHLKDIMWFSSLQQPLALYLGRDSKVQRGGAPTRHGITVTEESIYINKPRDCIIVTENHHTSTNQGMVS
jgi:hypothetical protein